MEEILHLHQLVSPIIHVYPMIISIVTNLCRISPIHRITCIGFLVVLTILKNMFVRQLGRIIPIYIIGKDYPIYYPIYCGKITTSKQFLYVETLSRRPGTR